MSRYTLPELIAELRRQRREVDASIDKLMSLIEQTDTPAPLLRRIEAREAERQEIDERLDRVNEEVRRANALAQVRESDVRKLLRMIGEDLALLDREHLKDALRGLVEAVVLCPQTRTGSIHLRIAASGVKVASPRGLVSNAPSSADAKRSAGM